MGPAAREDFTSAIWAIPSGMLRRVEISFPGVVSAKNLKQNISQHEPFGQTGVYFSCLS